MPKNPKSGGLNIRPDNFVKTEKLFAKYQKKCQTAM